jgi:hypothetical protein
MNPLELRPRSRSSIVLRLTGMILLAVLCPVIAFGLVDIVYKGGTPEATASIGLLDAPMNRLELTSRDGRNKITLDAETCEIIVTRLVDGIVEPDGKVKTSEIRTSIDKSGSGTVLLNCGDQTAKMMSGKHWGGVFAENSKEKTLCQMIALSGSSRNNTGFLVYDFKYKANAANAALCVDRGNAALQMSELGKVSVFHGTKLGAADTPMISPVAVLDSPAKDTGYGHTYAAMIADAARRRAMDRELAAIKDDNPDVGLGQ